MLKSSKSISLEDLAQFDDPVEKVAIGRFRWWICGIVTGLLTLVQANVHVYNFTVLSMQEEQKRFVNGGSIVLSSMSRA
ncbi:unnamed protein product [Caenorhabditis bovis]|uniref:Uncharacterized protein n=1 Tax=Caenorhabditis bovis TaxID=2654633 RepID=A0A8S1FEU0_9PELO|nr:unnamed protein product [Caenorhabditis bovis]